HPPAPATRSARPDVPFRQRSREISSGFHSLSSHLASLYLQIKNLPVPGTGRLPRYHPDYRPQKSGLSLSGNGGFSPAGFARAPELAFNRPDPGRPFSRGSSSLFGWSGLLRRSEEHTSELQSRENLVCRLLFE